MTRARTARPPTAAFGTTRSGRFLFGELFPPNRSIHLAVDDGTLLARAGRGDEQAFAELYARHQGALYRYALHMCREAADDIVQEAFLAVIRRPDRYDASRGTVQQYLFGIARHQVSQRIGELQSAVTLDAEVADESTPLDELLHLDSIARLRAAVDALPPPFREVVVLCDLQEVAYHEAAAILDCPIGTVRSRLHRARLQLARALSAEPAAAASGGKR